MSVLTEHLIHYRDTTRGYNVYLSNAILSFSKQKCLKTINYIHVLTCCIHKSLKYLFAKVKMYIFMYICFDILLHNSDRDKKRSSSVQCTLLCMLQIHENMTVYIRYINYIQKMIINISDSIVSAIKWYGAFSYYFAYT